MKPLLIALVFVLLGAHMTYNSVSELLTYSAAKAWPTVEGEVYGGGVETVGTGRKLRYRPAVKYRYEVGGKVLHADRLTLGDDFFSNIGDAQMLVNAFPTDTAVPVHYDPASPEHAYLSRGGSSGFWWMILAGLGMAGVGAAVVRHQWLKFKSDDFRTPLHE